MKVSFISDKLQVNHNLTGENNKVVLHVGSFELEKLAKLLLIPQETEINVTIEWEDE